MRRLALFSLFALMLANVGCAATFEAPAVHPDYIARTRSSHTFRLQSYAAEVPVERCVGAICVRNARARLEHGVEETLGQMAHLVADDEPADYVARLELVYIDSTMGTRWNQAEISVEWRFTLEDARTHDIVVRTSHTETTTVPSATLFASRFAMLEQEILTRIANAAAQSPLDDAGTVRMR